MKKILLTTMIAIFTAISSFADTSGVIGTLNWTLTDAGVLTITGTGDMPN